MAQPHVSLLHRSLLVLRSSPGTLITTIPCPQWLPDPLGLAPCLGFPCSWDPTTTGDPLDPLVIMVQP